ncbi:hypothetical protein JCM19047_3521 [Bacillus sp. JCM 19047]|nr:hypothetical protein JCM19047_3521 [Bacillus sp. JCM 19047]
MILGKPVLATKVGGLKEIVSEGCGYLLDKDIEFVNTVQLIINDKLKLEAMSAECEKRVNEFTDNKLWRKNLLDLYSEPDIS